MTVVETIKDTLAESFKHGLVFHTVEGYEQALDRAANKVFEALQDTIGTTQEKLLNDLTLARTELRAAEARENALRETCATLMDELKIVSQQEGNV